MADATWPGSLPTSALVGWTEMSSPNLIRSETDTGPAKIRRRSTSGIVKFDLSFTLDEEQTNTLVDFYEDEIGPGGTAGGTLTFSGFPHPRTDSEATVWRFLQPPSIKLVDKDIYTVQLQLELLPQ